MASMPPGVPMSGSPGPDNGSDGSADNRNNNENNGGLGGYTSPLVPGFLIAGMLLAIMATTVGWRRILHRRTRAGRGELRLYRVGMGVHANYVSRVNAATLRSLNNFVPLGPKPVLWDVWAEIPHEDSDGEECTSKWNDIKPLSVTFEPQGGTASSSTPHTKQTLPNAGRGHTPYAVRSFWRHPQHEIPPARRGATTNTNNNPTESGAGTPGHLRIAVLIAMPSPGQSASRASPSSSWESVADSRNVKGPYNDIPHDYVIGLSDIPWTRDDG